MNQILYAKQTWTDLRNTLVQMAIATMKLKDTPWKESYDQPR